MLDSDRDRTRLNFRRQFVLGDRFVETFAGWQRVTIAPALRLTAHPDLHVAHVGRDERSLTVIGDLIDPLQPERGNVEILQRLLAEVRTYEDVFDRAARLGGRWILIVNDGRRRVAFADAAGLRSLVYTTREACGTLWCASQSALIAEVCGVPLDAAAAAFRRAAAEQNAEIAWSPGDTTLHEGVRQLLANHYLDLDTGEARRFWPDRDLPKRSLRSAVAESRRLLDGLIQGARHRFRTLLVPMTAGWDSRLMLAASRAIAGQALFFTALFPGMQTTDWDVAVPERLLAGLQIGHSVVDCRGRPPSWLEDISERSVPMAQAQYLGLVSRLLDGTTEDAVLVKGDVGEIVRCQYRQHWGERPEPTAEDLAALTGMPQDPFLTTALERWLAGVRGNRYNVPILDLFFWEQEGGRLHQMIQSQCDLASESFAPLNCRQLISTMLSVPERDRGAPAFPLFARLIEGFWPETLTEEINGRQPQRGFEATVRRAVVTLRLIERIPRPVKRVAKGLLRIVP
jgi:hypothetical protein